MERGPKIGIIVAGVIIASLVIAARQQQSRANTDTGATTSSAELGGLSGMKTVEVFDPVLGQVAARLSVPSDWVFDGGLLRPHLGPSLVYRASSPDGLTGLQRLPRYDWVAHTDPQMRRFYEAKRVMIAAPMSAEELLTKYVLPESRPGVTVIGRETMPQLAKLTAGDEQANDRYAREAAGGRAKHQKTDAARMRITYDFNGHPVEEAIIAVITMTEIPALNGHTMQMSQAIVTGARAPRGKLDGSMQQLVAMAQSESADQGWQNRQNAFALQNAQAQQAAIIANARQRQAQNDAVFNNSMQNTAAMEKARHAGAMATADHMGDVQGMRNPATGQTGKVSNQFNYSYVDQNGNVVHTNSATYNPNAEMRGNWTQLQPIKP
ncbi:MAG: hypothetical protein ABJD07_08790 [Gemmatimonadaceae bacterium]